MTDPDKGAPKSEQQKIADMAVDKAEAARGILTPIDTKVEDVCQEPDPTGREGLDKMRDTIEKAEKDGGSDNSGQDTGTW